MRALPALTLLLCAAFCAPAYADAMRCGGRLVTDGTTRSEVRRMCGEPTEVQRRTILRRPHYELHGRIVYFGEGLIEIPVEIWTYNFGTLKLMRRIRFVDGEVEEIETLGYGYHESAEDRAERDTYR